MLRTPEQRQLELVLSDVRVRISWDGRSPRELTQVHISGIFKASAAKSVSEFVDPAQICFEFEHQKRPFRESPGGAPLLIPLPRR